MKKLISIAVLAAFLAPLSIGCGDTPKKTDPPKAKTEEPRKDPTAK